MRVLLYAIGAEDPGSPVWGHIRGSLLAAGHEVFSFDPSEAERLRMRGIVEDQRNWVLETFDPEVVVALSESDLGWADRRVLEVDSVSSDRDWSGFWAEKLPEPQVRVTKEGPKVSYVTAAYNIPEFIGLAIESILNQTFTDLEVIVVNDGSKDNTADVIRQYMSDPRVRLIEQPNIGQTGRFDFVFNTPSREARGEFIAVLGGDDIAMPERTARQLTAFEQDPGADVIHTAGVSIDEHGQVTGKVFELDFSYDTSSLLRRLVRGNNAASPTVTIRRDFFERAGQWTGGFCHDYEFWFKTARMGRMRYLPEPLTGYRIHSRNSSVGAGQDKGTDQGILTRLHERSKSSMVDLFPALARVPETDVAAWTAAYVDVGNGHLRYLAAPEAALEEYERALSFGHATTAIQHNIAIAYAMAGDLHESDRMITEVAASAPELYQRVQMHARTVHALVQGQEISMRPYELPIDIARETISWDGTPASLKRLLLVPDWNQPSGIAPLIEQYMSAFKADDDVDLVFPTLGLPQDTVLERLGSVIPSSVDLENGARLTLELWDHLEYLPLDRFSSILRPPAT